MSAARCTARVGVATARRAVEALAERLGRPLPPEAAPGADLWARSRRGEEWPGPAPLLRTADGWVHPGPPTAWSAFTDMVVTLGAAVPAGDRAWPDLTGLATDAVDAEAAEWLLPAAAVRTSPAPADRVPEVGGTSLAGARVVVLGTAWATPLVGRMLADLGATVVRAEHPRRPDPFPLRDCLARGQERIRVDLGRAPDRDRLRGALTDADLLVDGHPPRVLGNAGLGVDALADAFPAVSVLRIAAFVHSDRPGYGPAAEAHGGWAARHDPPHLARSSVADPVAGMVGALVAVELLTARAPGDRARISLEGAVGHLLARERSGE